MKFKDFLFCFFCSFVQEVDQVILPFRKVGALFRAGNYEVNGSINMVQFAASLIEGECTGVV